VVSSQPPTSTAQGNVNIFKNFISQYQSHGVPTTFSAKNGIPNSHPNSSAPPLSGSTQIQTPGTNSGGAKAAIQQVRNSSAAYAQQQ